MTVSRVTAINNSNNNNNNINSNNNNKNNTTVVFPFDFFFFELNKQTEYTPGEYRSPVDYWKSNKQQ